MSMSNKANYVPDSGDVITIDFDPQAGNEQAGRRPAIVLSAANYNGKTGLAVVCPITNQAKGYPFEVPIPSGHGVTGVVLADHIKSVALAPRNAKFRCKVPPEVIEEVRAKLSPLLGIG